jgi:hypothetical protein
MKKHKVTTIAQIKQYLREMCVTGRVDDDYPRIQHARNVDKVAEEVVWAIVRHADDDSIEIGTRINQNGTVHEVNMGWFTKQGRPFAAIYNSRERRIEIRDRNREGKVNAGIDNSLSDKIDQIFAAL